MVNRKSFYGSYIIGWNLDRVNSLAQRKSLFPTFSDKPAKPTHHPAPRGTSFFFGRIHSECTSAGCTNSLLLVTTVQRVSNQREHLCLPLKIGESSSSDSHKPQMIRPIPTPITALFHSGSKAECILFLVVEDAQIIISRIKPRGACTLKVSASI